MDNEIILNQHICRGKRIDNNEWVYGYYVAVPEECSHGKDIVHAIFTTECEHICMGEYKDHGWYEVDPKSVGRYTGLDDKNFQPIFENDIVKNSKGEIGEIVWFGHRRTGTSFSINYITRYADGKFFKPQDMMLDIIRRDTEIIGNIFDNPELLDGNNDSDFIVPSLNLLHDKITAEEQSEIIDKFNSIGCTSFMITSEGIQKILGDYFNEN